MSLSEQMRLGEQPTCSEIAGRFRTPTVEEDFRYLRDVLMGTRYTCQEAVEALDRIKAAIPKPDEPKRAGARRTDPVTSQKAADKVAPQAAGQRGRMLKAIVDAGERGLTNHEMELATGVPGNGKRTSEMEREGWIVATGEERKNDASNAMQQVYVATEAGKAWAA